jgi:hypothetical protein
LGQYDLGLVQTEREGSLDNPRYIDGLPKGHPLRSRENVFAFSVACASRQLLQFLSMVIEPLGENSFAPEHYHFVGDFSEPQGLTECLQDCPLNVITALGNEHPLR